VTPEAWRGSWRKRLELSVIAGLGYPMIAGLGHTLRWRVEGIDHLDSVIASGRQPVMAFWHGRILPAAFYFRRRGIVVITSENFDGEWIARIIGWLGYGTARGSTTRGGRRALVQLVRALANGRSVGFTLDGPTGPARVAQAGAVWLAQETGNPLVPFHVEASAAWHVRSWDRTQIPKPFSTVAIAVGEPMYLPKDRSAAAIEGGRVALEARLHALERRALQMLQA
jgi:lysophospholipid acyltransferase (LPLAT)-like uncharacterized protein